MFYFLCAVVISADIFGRSLCIDIQSHLDYKYIILEEDSAWVSGLIVVNFLKILGLSADIPLHISIRKTVVLYFVSSEGD